MPHISAHLPTNVPSVSGVTSNRFVRPGTTSILNRNDGIQKEWMTSGEVSSNSTFSSTGRYKVGEVGRGAGVVDLVRRRS